MAEYEYVQRDRLEEELVDQEPAAVEDEAKKILDAWKPGGGIWSRPAIYANLLIFGANDGCLYALDRATGELKWKVLTGGNVIGSPVISEGIAYFGSFDNKFYAVDVNTGERVWEFFTGGRIPGTAAVIDGLIYFGSEDGKLYCLSKDGTKRWEFLTGGIVVATPSVLNGRVYFGSMDKRFYCVEDGRKVWSFLTGGWVGDGAIVDLATGKAVTGFRAEPRASSLYEGNEANLRVCLGSFDGYFYCLDIHGRERWKFQADDAIGIMRGYAVHDSVVYFGAHQLFAVDVRQGAKVWTFRPEDRIGGWAQLYHDGAVFTGSYDGNLYALDAKTGRSIFVFRTGGPTFSPAIVDKNILYFGSNDTFMYALDLSTGKTVWTFQTGAPPAPVEWRGIIRSLNPFRRLLRWWKPELPKNRAYDKEEPRGVEWAGDSPYQFKDPYVMKEGSYSMKGQAYQGAKKKDDDRGPGPPRR